MLWRLQDKMNQVQLEDGRLPEKGKMNVRDEDYADGKNLKIGDKVTHYRVGLRIPWKIHQDDTFTIVGTVSSPEYIAFHRGKYNNRKWKCQCLSLRSEKAFSLDVYTEITVQVEGAKEATAFTKEYEEHVDSALKRFKAIKEERTVRYDEIVSTAGKSG